jgi:hypothetical protein
LKLKSCHFSNVERNSRTEWIVSYMQKNTLILNEGVY